MLWLKKKEWGFCPFLLLPLFFLLLLTAVNCTQHSYDTVLRIYDWKTGELYIEVPAKTGEQIFFGWIHSLEKFPWHEYFRIDKDLSIVLEAITFPAFGAGVPENKGSVCYTDKDGLIHMEQINQRFGELIWLNSHTAVQDIKLGDALVTKGRELPQHTRLRLVIEKKRSKIYER
jgi:hypothetical protein